MIVGFAFGVVAVIGRIVFWNLLKQYVFRGRVLGGSAWKGLRGSSRRAYQNRLGPAQVPELYVVDLPGHAPPGYCWECGRVVKPTQAVCLGCGAAQVRSPVPMGDARVGARPGPVGAPPAGTFPVGEPAAPGVYSPQPSYPQYAPPSPYPQPSYPQYARQQPHLSYPQSPQGQTWGYPQGNRD